MGAIYVDVTIRNLAERDRCRSGRFLVDTGATDSLVPARWLRDIGLEPEETRSYELADGRALEIGVATARFEFMDSFTAGIVLFGDDDAEPLLGVTALESVGVEVDPREERLKKLPTIRLKRAA